MTRLIRVVPYDTRDRSQRRLLIVANRRIMVVGQRRAPSYPYPATALMPPGIPTLPPMRTTDFDYELPESSIAQTAIEPRHDSRLLDVRRNQDRRFFELPDLLDPGDLLVVNRTRVRAARLRGHRLDSGGAVEALLLRRLDEGDTSDEGTRWEALVRPARRLRPGVRIGFGAQSDASQPDGSRPDVRLTGEVLSTPVDGMVSLRLTGADDVEATVATHGAVPLPPYFHGALADPERYQTIFASAVGSAAAPTAGLHFTPTLVERLTDTGIEFAEVELEVGLDTFRPMTVDAVSDHVIHRERYRIPEATAAAHRRTRGRGGRVVAVGTTVVRTLETAATTDGGIDPGEGESALFITPGYRFTAIDAMLTNFHAPRTTLIALVAAAIGPRWRQVYESALQRRYRFLSFGDAMFISPLGDPGGIPAPATPPDTAPGAKS